ncbi:PREDICTED: zinc finger protein CONSTANS-LIKE 2-like [Lupinus angustifolius]|uniref:zinc finger protein CONSTANS-LIKE 2-like n=1 Tax=Lupinus angustifolius TaxID=3871 RepID=UPI00092E4142|nr:PREDICTED: zinc finger protein CONSTANS-LIKE 2-like [Lupinus angustifolius]
MKKCELCKVTATTFCESDQASLCWDCDAKVHGANFLVARHTRTLLCHTCHSLTPWKASGAFLGNTVSLCEGCAGGTRVHADEVDESEGDNDDEVESSDDEVEDEDGDNQVVPWSSTATTPPACSSSCVEGSVTRFSHGYDYEDVSESDTTVSVKRRREDNDSQEGSKRRHVHSGERRLIC